MPAPIDPKLKAQIRRAYVNSKLTFQELARQFDVSDRSIQNWAKAENWDAERKAENVIEFARQPKQERPTIRAAANSENPIEIANMVITDLQGEMRSDMSGKDKAAVANALKTWVEYREKLQPPTVKDLVDRAITLGIGPDEFLRELKNAWSARA